MIGRPTEREYMAILNLNELKNNSVTAKDAKTAFKVYGLVPAAIMSNVTMTSHVHVDTSIISVPRRILDI